MLDFIAPLPREGLAKSKGDRPSAIPGNVRGMALLHSRYGKLKWADLLTRAEDLARGGVIMSEGAAQALARAAGPLFADEQVRAVFAKSDGQPYKAGESFRQVDLAVTLGQIRAHGAGIFYTGNLANRLVAGVERAGGSLTKGELRDMVPQWRPAPSVTFDGGEMFVAGPPALGGVAVAQMWQMLVTDSRYRNAPAEERLHLLAEVTRRALNDRRRLLAANGSASSEAEQLMSAQHARGLMTNYDPAAATPITAFQARPEDTQENPSGTGFVVVDGTGLTVACNVTLYNPFGTGRLVPGVGIFLAQAPGVGSRNPHSLSPVIVTGTEDRVFRFAAAGAGGGAIPPAIVNVAARTLLDGRPLEEAMQGGRVYASPSSPGVVVETSESPPRVETLVRRGHEVHQLDALARLNVVSCETGLPTDSLRDAKCSVASDGGREGMGAQILIQLE
jgi:gamma-glutamyltranspeptidase/glutathione hydrolase